MRADLGHRRVGQGADRVEGGVAHQLEPDLRSDVGHRGSEARGCHRLRELAASVALRAIRFPQRELHPLQMLDHSRLDDLGGRVERKPVVAIDLFRDRAKSLELISYHESTEMRGIGVWAAFINGLIFIQVIVPKESAVIGVSGEISSSLNGNHLEIVKFLSKEDDNYITVAGNLSVLMRKVIIPRPDDPEGHPE